MKITTARFGPIDVDDRAVITMPKGLIGLPSRQRFVLLDQTTGAQFRWLQSVDDPALALLVVESQTFFPDYEEEITDADSELLGISAPDEAHILATVTACSEPVEVTVNLLGPLVVSLKTGRAAQVVQDDGCYSSRALLMAPTTRDGAAPVSPASSA